MQDIQDTMIEIYRKNLNFLKEKHQNIYNKIVLFEKNMIEMHHINIFNGHIELINKENEPTYKCDPFYDAQYRSKNIFNNENIFALINSSSKILDYGDFNEKVNSATYLNEYISIIKNKTNLEYDINKFIFIGTLLGVHLNDIDKVINAKAYLIIEPNIEIFRLSLFLTDYEDLSKNSKLFFSINDIDEKMKETIKKFLFYKSSYNNFIRFELASKNEIYLVSIINEFLTLENKIRYPFSEYIYSLKRGYHYLKTSNNGILNLSTKKDFLKDLPLLYLAAGPSLDKNIEFIKSIKDKFIIVAAAAILKFLEFHEIKPDIILSIDAGKSTVQNQFDIKQSFYENSIIISSIKTDIEVFSEINNSNVFFIQNELELITNFGIFTGVTVGDIGIKILLALGSNNMYLLGLDASINEETGETHFSSYYYNKNIEKNNSNDYKNYLVSVKGNFKDTVKTTLLYKDMIDSINEIDLKLIEDSNIYNLSDGAYFNNTKKLKLLDLNLNLKTLNKIETNQIIKNQLRTISQKGLSNLEIKEIKKEQKIIKKIKSLKNIKKEFDNIQTKYSNSFVVQIINEYFLLTNPYNYYMENESIQQKQINEIISEFETIYIN